ncbi:MAG TPA: HD domain-containing protein [Candidatus Acidoferrum sp.]|nr:HD domain-containing protein [Candidatus Acidoferrum sp.]
MIPTRDEAIAIWKKYNTDEALYRHALAVEGVMRYFAEKMGGDPELWGVVGLLHDIDYQLYPDEHCFKARELLEAEGLDEVIIRAVQSHGYSLVNDVTPQSDMEKTVFTIDELTGLVAANAVMRPSKSVLDMEVKSLKKKFKDKHFAAGINRDVIVQGCEMMGMELDAVMEDVIMGMREVAEEIGLKGDVTVS